MSHPRCLRIRHKPQCHERHGPEYQQLQSNISTGTAGSGAARNVTGGSFPKKTHFFKIFVEAGRPPKR